MEGPSTLGGYDEEGCEEEDVCRICRMPGEPDSPLYYPCQCNGSIRWVHQDCLLQWLKHSSAVSCEVCKHPFTFSPVYAPDAPSRLPPWELFKGLVFKVTRGGRVLARLNLVLTVWLMIVPYATSWLWRLAFAKTWSMQEGLLPQLAPLQLLSDCLFGSFLSAGIVFTFLGATAIKEYVRQLQEPVPGGNVQAANQGGLVGDFIAGLRDGQEDAAEQLGGRHVPGGDAAQEGPPGEGLQILGAAAAGDAQAGGVLEVDNLGQEVPFEELIGMQGPVLNLLENAITVLVSNALFLGAVIMIPFHIGRLVVITIEGSPLLRSAVAAFVAWKESFFAPEVIEKLVQVASSLKEELTNGSETVLSSETGGLNASSVSASSVSALSSILSQGEQLLANQAAGNLTGELVSRSAGNGSLTETFLAANASAIEQVVNATMGSTGGNATSILEDASTGELDVSNAATLFAGYAIVVLGLGVWLLVWYGVKRWKGESILHRQRGVGVLIAAAPEAARQVVAGFRYFLTSLKVSFLLGLELGVFPLLCGWWLDFCTFALLGATWADRLAFLEAAPFTCALLHWLSGVIYMLQLSVFASLNREVLRPGVLSFLRDPADPNYNPFRDLVEEPLHRHLRRVALSLLIYGVLVVLLVFIPIRLALACRPALFPLNLRFSDPFTEVPADMLLFHICIPFTVEHFKPRATVKWLLAGWFKAVGEVLGLAEFLLPAPGGAERNGNGNGLPAEEQQLAAQMANLEIHEPDGTSHQPQNADAPPQAGDLDGLFPLRIVALIFLGWLTLLGFNSLAVLVPVSVGRSVFGLVARIPIASAVANCNDIYTFGVGCYILWGGGAAARYLVRYLQTHDLVSVAVQVYTWAVISAKAALLLTLWLGAVPLLVGLLFELLVVIPLRVPVDESPVFLLYQDWALGLLFLKIWTRLVMVGQGPFANEAWKAKFEQVQAVGLRNVRALWTLREIILPVISNLLTALCGPYVIARGVFPLTGSSLLVSSLVYRFIWQWCLAAAVVWKTAGLLRDWARDLHNSIRDERYLVGRTLHNFGQPPPPAPAPPSHSTGVEPSRFGQLHMHEAEAGPADSGGSAYTSPQWEGPSNEEPEVASEMMTASEFFANDKPSEVAAAMEGMHVWGESAEDGPSRSLSGIYGPTRQVGPSYAGDLHPNVGLRGAVNGSWAPAVVEEREIVESEWSPSREARHQAGVAAELRYRHQSQNGQ